MPVKKINLLIAEDQFLIQQVLLQVFAEEENTEVVGEVSSIAELLTIASEKRPDVILFNAELKGLRIDQIEDLKKKLPETEFVVLIRSDNKIISKLMQIGVVGYLEPSFDRQQLIRAIEITSQGKVFLHPEIAKNLLGQLKGWLHLQVNSGEAEKLNLLTKREREVICLVAQGRDNVDIANKLFISDKTVRNHLSSIFKKLGFRDRTQAALWAVRVGVVPITESPYL